MTKNLIDYAIILPLITLITAGWTLHFTYPYLTEPSPGHVCEMVPYTDKDFDVWFYNNLTSVSHSCGIVDEFGIEHVENLDMRTSCEVFYSKYPRSWGEVLFWPTNTMRTYAECPAGYQKESHNTIEMIEFFDRYCPDGTGGCVWRSGGSYDDICVKEKISYKVICGERVRVFENRTVETEQKNTLYGCYSSSVSGLWSCSGQRVKR